MRAAQTIGLLTALAAGAMAPTGHAAQRDVPGSVRVRTVEADGIEGQIESFSLTGGLVLRLGESRRLEASAADVVDIDTRLAPRQPHPESLRWVMSDGDVVHGKVVAGTDRTVTIRQADLGRLPLPLTRLRSFGPSVGVKAHAITRWAQSETQPSSQDDELLLASGDRLVGLIARIEPTGITVETDDGQTNVGLDVLLEARLARAGSAPTSTRRAEPLLRARLTLADGSRVTVSRLGWQRDRLLVGLEDSDTSVAWELGTAQVRRVEVLGGRWQWLEDRPAVLAEHTPLLDVRRPHRLGRNVVGGPIRVGGRTFEHGIGVHSRSRLVFRLDPRCRRFVTGYGLDDDSGPMADVDVKILLDGKTVHEARDVRADGEIRRVAVDLKGAAQLELLVDYGKNGHVQDRFDWIEPALIRGQ